MKINVNFNGAFVENGCGETYDIKPIKGEMEISPIEMISYINAVKDVLGEDVVKTLAKTVIANI